MLERETLDLQAIINILGERPFAPKSNFKAYLEYKREKEEEVEEKKSEENDDNDNNDDDDHKKTNKEGKSIRQTA